MFAKKINKENTILKQGIQSEIVIIGYWVSLVVRGGGYRCSTHRGGIVHSFCLEISAENTLLYHPLSWNHNKAFNQGFKIERLRAMQMSQESGGGSCFQRLLPVPAPFKMVYRLWLRLPLNLIHAVFMLSF